MRLTCNQQVMAKAILENLIQTKTPISYAEFALRLELTGPQKINRVIKWLEKITLEDASKGAPIRASMVFSKFHSGLPSSGFFEFCKEIGLFNWNNEPSRAQYFIQSQQKALFSKKTACK